MLVLFLKSQDSRFGGKQGERVRKEREGEREGERENE